MYRIHTNTVNSRALDAMRLKKMPSIVHFEIPADDIERAKKFYSNLFGWKIEGMPGMEPGMEYLMIDTLALQEGA